MKLYFLLLNLLLATTINAQTIQGKVLDKESLEGLIFANVTLEQNGTQFAGTTTDLEGNYILTGFDPGEYSVRVVYIGYQDKLITGIKVGVSKTIPLDIEMNNPINLSEVIVNAYKIPLIEHDNTASGYTVTAQEVRKMPTRNRKPLTAKTAGVGQSKQGTATSFRGARETNDIIFIDGVRTRRSSVPAAVLEGTQIVTSGTPAQYGEVSKLKEEEAALKKHKNRFLNRVSARSNAPERTDPQWNNEQYAKIVENEFKDSEADPLSTFSIDVDKASYSNIRRYLKAGQRPPTDAVRIEEMVNYFNYNYPQPKEEHPFSIYTEVGECPWNSKNKLVLIGLKGKELDIRNAPPSNLVFLIDVSGSMHSNNKLPLVKESLKMLVASLRAEDRIAIVTYAGSERLALPSTPGNQKQQINLAIESLGAGGSTAGSAGIKLAYEVGMKNLKENGNNRVILATDGDFNVGVSSDAELENLIVKKRKTGIYLTVLGYGTGNYKDSKMETLADKGNGNYAYIDNSMEAKKVLVNEMSGTLFTIAKDVKIQVEFNPAQVKEYNLIGYENRLLNKEDFNDDKKDAGEIGAGHTVTALYEIVPVNSNDEETASTAKVDPLIYQQSALTSKANQSSEIMQLKLRYKLPASKTSILLQQPVNLPKEEINTSEHFRFAASIAAFGKLLRKTKHPMDLKIREIKSMALSALGKDKHGYRKEFIRLLNLYKP